MRRTTFTTNTRKKKAYSSRIFTYRDHNFVCSLYCKYHSLLQQKLSHGTTTQLERLCASVEQKGAGLSKVGCRQGGPNNSQPAAVSMLKSLAVEVGTWNFQFFLLLILRFWNFQFLLHFELFFSILLALQTDLNALLDHGIHCVETIAFMPQRKLRLDGSLGPVVENPQHRMVRFLKIFRGVKSKALVNRRLG